MSIKNLNHKLKEDFQFWMRPALRNYYTSKINFLKDTILETIPEYFNIDLLRIALGQDGYSFDLQKLNEALYKPMCQYIKVSGKLFRPLISCIFIEGYGKNSNQFKPLLAISEIIHSCSLILDDIADSSQLRRGNPCAHLVYGIPRAANASSTMTFFTFRLLQSDLLILDNNQKIKLFEALLWEHYITSIGSALDLGWTKERINEIKEDQYIQHIIFRSSSYTYRHAARIGAIAGGADDSDLKSIFQYGSMIGVAFQFIDDILNLKPGSENWGKIIGEDITEGKRSPLVLHTIKVASDSDCTRLLKILDSKETDPFILQEAISILEKHDSFNVVKEKANLFVEKACMNILKTKLSNEYKELLIDLAWYVVERKI
jgi:geranylgeranyl diphosphate synthase type I/geranylgeranyl diphosphate synthase type II